MRQLMIDEHVIAILDDDVAGMMIGMAEGGKGCLAEPLQLIHPPQDRVTERPLGAGALMRVMGDSTVVMSLRLAFRRPVDFITNTWR